MSTESITADSMRQLANNTIKEHINKRELAYKRKMDAISDEKRIKDLIDMIFNHLLLNISYLTIKYAYIRLRNPNTIWKTPYLSHDLGLHINPAKMREDWPEFQEKSEYTESICTLFQETSHAWQERIWREVVDQLRARGFTCRLFDWTFVDYSVLPPEYYLASTEEKTEEEIKCLRRMGFQREDLDRCEIRITWSIDPAPAQGDDEMRTEQ